MPQELDQQLNPWARYQANVDSIIEPQRADLFTVDLSAPASRIQAILASSSSHGAQVLADLIPGNLASLRYWANAVELPEVRVGASNVKRHEVPYPWPASDEAVGQLAITFTQEVSVEDEPMSAIVALLYGWRAIVRAGRAGTATDENEIALGLIDAGDYRASGQPYTLNSLIPNYRHNFTIEQWRGRAPDPGATDVDLQLSASWRVVRGWLSAVQVNSMRHAQVQVQEIRATFYADAILPVLPTSVRHEPGLVELLPFAIRPTEGRSPGPLVA